MYELNVFIILLLGVAISIVEMMMGFKSNNKYNKGIMYKAQGGVFQANKIFQDGLTYHIFINNDPDPQKHMDQGLSPVHAIGMAIFDVLKYMYHCFTVEFFYNSAYFYHHAYNHEKKVLFHGVTRKVCVIFLPMLYKSRK